MRRMRILHAIHDFVPRHQAGSEIYAHDLAVEQARRHDVWVLAAEHDPAAVHGTLRWRRCGTLPVVELINNWRFRDFDESYSSPRLNERLDDALSAIAPDVLHVHNLLNLSLDLPRLARERGAAVVATLHDYTLVCIAGGQRVHRAEHHVCAEIEPDRCARCFPESPVGLKFTAGRLTASARIPRLPAVASTIGRRLPVVATAARAIAGPSTTIDDVHRRLAYARHVFDMIDLFVAPSAAMAEEYARLGLSPERIEISRLGHAIGPAAAGEERQPNPRTLRVGYVGSIVWHKGVHVLLEAARGLRGSVQVFIHGDVQVDPAYVRELRAAGAGLPVVFAGAFERGAVESVYRSLDVLVVPSLWPENAPLVIQEAWRHGIPVVASRIGGLPEFIRDDVDGRLFAAGSADELRRVLQSLIDDRARLARLSSAPHQVKSIALDAAEWDRRYASLPHLHRDSDAEWRADASGAARRDRPAGQAS